MEKKINKEISSFRDPAGYIYYEKGDVYRKIFPCYFKQYDFFMSSGLYQELVDKKLIVTHKEVKRTKEYILLKVEKVPFISYPYEWGFKQLKDASLLTLEIARIALEYGMILKDASGYNVQFLRGKPIFIDTLSFDFYEEGSPWGAYGQFVRHFMTSLLVMRYVDERLVCLLRNYIDGIPVDIADSLLKGRGGFTTKQHITWHSRSISRYADSNNKKKTKQLKMSKRNLVQMFDMMIRQIEKLTRLEKETEWGDYYQHTNYDDISKEAKKKIVKKYVSFIKFDKDDILFDIGANDGKYSRIASDNNINVVSFDIDYNCVNHNYYQIKKKGEDKILPLFLDCTNPTSSIGFNVCERKSLNDRGNVKGVMALALIHHLAISNNVPFKEIAYWFAKLGENLIIEFVPKDDSQVEKLLKTRKDIFPWYHIDCFEECFSKYFKIVKKTPVENSKRTIYLMRRLSGGK